MSSSTEQPDDEPHAFDQTNGIVDLGVQQPDADDGRAEERNRVVGGIAMLSANRPMG